MGHHIGFVGTRFAGTDGVSLETAKWAAILEAQGHECFYYAGNLDRDPKHCMLVPHAYFGHQDIDWINDRAFGAVTRSPEVTRRIYSISDHLKKSLYDFTGIFDIDILIAENSLCIPMNVPLGLALTNFIAETGFPTIAHHHDFYWERDRFSVSAIGDILWMAFPPSLPSLHHVTINSAAQQDLCHRKGESSELIPNVLDFETPPPVADKYAAGFRDAIGLSDDDIMFLQPTRIVPRKGIEHSISLVSALRDPRIKLVITHESGDEGNDYLNALVEMADRSNVPLILTADHVDEERGRTPDGEPVFTLADAYSQADFITYPSLYEGFGNALLEAFYFKKPVLVNRYSIFIMDIEPKGFEVIAMDGYLTNDTIRQVQHVIDDDEFRERMVQHNYDLSRAFYSYTVLRRKLNVLLTNFTGME